MTRILAYLRYLFDTPSAFYDDPVAYARNVVLHSALIGLVAAQAGRLIPGYEFALGGAIYAVWELAQWRLRKAIAADCFEDWAFVMAGALAWLTLDWRVAIVALAFLASGVSFRSEMRLFMGDRDG